MPSENITTSKTMKETVNPYNLDPATGKVTYGVPYTQGPAVVESLSLVRTSVRTPGWNRKRMKNTSPMNPFDFSSEKVLGPMYRGAFVQQTGYPFSSLCPGQVMTGAMASIAYPDFVRYFPVQQADINALDATARNKLRLKAKDQKSNLLQVYAEREQTARLFGEVALKITRSLAALKKFDYNSAAHALGLRLSRRQKQRMSRNKNLDADGFMSKSWLELQYGWKPLLNDVYGSAELIAQKNIREVIDKATAQASRKFEDVQVLKPRNWTVTTRRVTEYTIKYGVYYSTSELQHTLAQVGLTNPALIAWELLPWSFVIDWFIPIGNFIGSWDATIGLDFYKGYKTVFVRQYYVSSAKATYVGSYPETEFWRGTAETSGKLVTVKRTVLTSFPMSGLPSFKNPISFDHVANAMALLTQLHRK
jgi:hypothetical protein